MDDPRANLSPEAPSQASFEPGSQLLPKFWSVRDLLLFISFAFFALPVAYVAVLGGTVALQYATGFRAPFLTVQDSAFFLITVQVAFYGLLLGYIYFLVVVSYRQPFWSALKWRRPKASRTAGFFLGGLLLAVAVQFAPTLLPEKHGFPLERLFTSPGAAYAVGAFAILVAPFMEELIFRGVIFAVVERHGGPAFAVLSTALLFAGLHVPEYWGAWNHVLLILLVGLVFSLARGLTGSLIPSVILHLAYNATQMTVLFFATHHFRSLHAVVIG